MIRLRIALAFCLVAFCAATAAGASFTGTFTNDTDLVYFTFTLANPTAGVTLRTWSYAGGTNGAGDPIAAGGFEPYLNLYLADGTQMNPGTSGPCTVPTTGNPIADLLPDAVTGACGDVYYPTERSFPGGVWAAGTYIVVLSSAANPGIGNLSDGFFAEQILAITAPANFTCQTGPTGVQGTPPTYPVGDPFCDTTGSGFQRDGHWALDIIGVDSATQLGEVPEPATWSLALLGGAYLLLRRRSRRA